MIFCLANMETKFMNSSQLLSTVISKADVFVTASLVCLNY